MGVKGIPIGSKALIKGAVYALPRTTVPREFKAARKAKRVIDALSTSDRAILEKLGALDPSKVEAQLKNETQLEYLNKKYRRVHLTNHKRTVKITVRWREWVSDTYNGGGKYNGKQKDIRFQVPLVVSADLPLKKKPIKLASKKNGYMTHSVMTKPPVPPQAALAALNEAKNDFDAFCIWWVPNDMYVTTTGQKKKPLPPPDLSDPIIVGKVTAPSGDKFFEIYRWEDEVVENPYWAHEAY